MSQQGTNEPIENGRVKERLRLRNGRVALVLDRLADGPGTPLLLLHAMGEDATVWQDHPLVHADEDRRWPGPVFALHFSGHGASDWLAGSLYFPEILAADADHALEAIEARHPGAALRVAGRGAGAYAGLLLAGARADAIEATLLLPGPGLSGGAAHPNDGGAGAPPLRVLEELAASHRRAGNAAGNDPATASLARDVRPADYAQSFARRARGLCLADGLEDAPPWWTAARALDTTRVVAADPVEAFAALRPTPT